MMPMPQILNRPKFRSSSCGWPEALISLVSGVLEVDLVVEFDDCSATTTNFSMFQTAVSMVALAWMAEWPEFWYVWTNGQQLCSLFTRNEKEQRGAKINWVFCWWDFPFSNASKSETRLPKLVCHELAFAFTLLFNWLMYRYIISEFWRQEVRGRKVKRDHRRRQAKTISSNEDTPYGRAADPQLQWTSQAVIITKSLGISRGPRSNNEFTWSAHFRQPSYRHWRETLKWALIPLQSPYLRSVKDFFFLFLSFLFLNLVWYKAEAKSPERTLLTHKYLTTPPRTWEYI